MTYEAVLHRVRDLALSLPGTSEGVREGAPAFLIENEPVFAHVQRISDGALLVVQTSGAEEQARLIEAEPELYESPERPDASEWVSMRLCSEDGDWDRVADRIAISWEMVAPQRLLEAGGR